ncbi:hypothetical protein [uncultured Actinomyces sp.]|uniref:hypothetical protein n=1 Tax=uncultured Actinomyces sp. TaxID=249061 RepID=UPI0025E5ADDA|nr:hypothetical protein [uncultured Actinomyces sp.]
MLLSKVRAHRDRVGNNLFAGAVAVRHGGAVGSLRILGGQALAEAVAQLADDRRGHEARVVRVGCGGVVGRVHCLRCGSCAVRVGGGGEDDHVPRGQAAHVERESRAALLIRARRDVKGRWSASAWRPPSAGLTEKWTFPPVDVSAVIVACLPGSCVDLSV